MKKIIGLICYPLISGLILMFAILRGGWTLGGLLIDLCVQICIILGYLIIGLKMRKESIIKNIFKIFAASLTLCSIYIMFVFFNADDRYILILVTGSFYFMGAFTTKFFLSVFGRIFYIILPSLLIGLGFLIKQYVLPKLKNKNNYL